MNKNTYAEFLERLGHKVIKTDTYYWYNIKPFIFLSFPFHKDFNVNSEEIKKLFREEKILILKYTALNKGKPTYRLILNDKNYDLKNLSSKARNQTRRGLENCKVEQIDFKYLKKVGFEIYISTLQRQGRKVGKNFYKYWNKYCDIARETEGFEAWGAFVNGKLSSFIIGFIMDDCYNIFIQRSKRDFLKFYPNNALVFHLSYNMIRRDNINMISYGLSSLRKDIKGLDHFKIGMGFNKQETRQVITTNYIIKPFIKLLGVTHKSISKFIGNKELAEKLNGMIEYME